ncbi:carbamoyltransferase HypF [Tsukamurella soli]|uniref:Carbamoyltransferase n=1 Tax=Tsukamurella soli TaxID=644556 RepID=A0ABP8K1P5_9ACTN
MSAPTARHGVVRESLIVRGVVQGVGFRPHLARIAAELGLVGQCRNDSTAVVIEVEGAAERVEAFATRLVGEAPPLARIASVSSVRLVPCGGTGFVIAASTSGSGLRTMVPPDAATCADCLREMFDPADRRYRHPFISCTNCGPRFTITVDLPYDRRTTTMADFPMCPRCSAEYADPTDRRFHAQPIACHGCGPTLTVTGTDGRVLASGTEPSLAAIGAIIDAGEVVAIKGLGGYHLVCDAGSDGAVGALRRRKHRPDQPFAVMARDIDAVASLVALPEAAVPVLTGSEHPILLLPRRIGAAVSDSVAPGLDELGVLLPYTPVHHLLMECGRPLVVTSGNLSGDPLCFDDDDARARLGAIATAFLSHDRAIAVPCEDSVLAWAPGAGPPLPVRRSRGYAPLPIELPLPGAGPAGSPSPAVLAAGAEVKNTAALARDGQAFLSAHIGDLGSWESRLAHQAATDQMLRFHRRSPAVVVADRHPGYASRAWAVRLAADLGVPLVEVQHHHAHLAALAAETGTLDARILGLVLDGTGYGCDATVWGGEALLLGDGGTTAARLGHLGEVPLPGGDAGVRNPVRVAAALMLAHGVDLDGTPVAAELTDAERRLLTAAAPARVGWVRTSSAGRLFDAVSSLLGIRHRISYEAQAAVELEVAARRTDVAVPLRFPLLGIGGAAQQGAAVLDPGPLIADIADAVRAGVAAEVLARSFHHALADGLARLTGVLAEQHRPDAVGLTGGVFGNRLLAGLLCERLAMDGHRVLTHREVPPNDGGIALGQVAICAAGLARGRPPAGHPTASHPTASHPTASHPTASHPEHQP